MNRTGDDTPDHSEIEELMPWHAAGTLSPHDARRVEEALARDPELARRYETVREELGATIHLNETLGAPSTRAMDTLFAKIDAEPVRRRMPSLDLAARIAGFFDSLSPRTLAWSAAAAALVIVLQCGLIGGVLLRPKPAGVYQTASATHPPTTTGAFVLVRFAPQARAADLTTFLEGENAAIVDGPTAGGFYRVRVAAAPLPQARLADVVTRLQKDKVVDFAAASQ
jgi:anti-sigma factor RsiW